MRANTISEQDNFIFYRKEVLESFVKLSERGCIDGHWVRLSLTY